MEMVKLKSNMNKKIGIIGMGHMGKALMKGLVSTGFAESDIAVSNNAQNNRKVVQKADWIFIVVKPSKVLQVLENSKDLLTNKIVISSATGVSVAKIEKYAQKIIRIMPNITVSYNEGVIGMFANKNVSKVEKNEVVKLLSLLGMIILCKSESDLDALTIISGCGSAIVAYFIEMLAQSGQKFGLSKNVSEKVTLQTFLGTCMFLQKTNQSALQLQKNVATKGGITEEILQSLDDNGLQILFAKSLKKGKMKINALKASR
jgi:pyrroline-5-carboxylate reductase